MFRVIEVKGKDAADFLHRVTAGTVKRLAVGDGAPGLLLTGQSRMIAQFDLLRIEDMAFWLVSPEPCASALAEKLEALHFAEALEIRNTGLTVGVEPGEGERGKIFPFTAVGNVRAWPSGVPGFRCVSGSRPAPEAWDFARIGVGYAWPLADWDFSTPALEAGVEAAIDRNKGCYPGQEVVERSLNVGHPARLLIAVEGEGELVAGQKVNLMPQGEALVRSVAVRGKSVRAFLLMPWAHRESAPAGFRRIPG